MSALISHIEQHCGVILHGWSSDPDGNKAAVQVVQTKGGPSTDATTFTTLGLSNHLLTSVSDRRVRQELVMPCRADSVPGNLPALLQQVASEALGSHAAYLRGQVIGPRGALFPGSALSALYVAIPVCFPDSFASVDIGNSRTVIFAWLVPIASSEADFVQSNGWDVFEERLIKQNPDLLDYTRRTIV
jgi:hypothetical protein